MRKLILVLGLFALIVGFVSIPRAEAAEHQLGTILITDGGCVHNLFATDGGAFAIPPLQLITIQPDNNSFVCVEELSSTKAPTCSGTNVNGTKRGIYALANTAIPSSCDPAHPVLMADGGLVTSCVVTVCASGVSVVNVPVWSRRGNEF